jgi:hypothetical protein
MSAKPQSYKYMGESPQHPQLAYQKLPVMSNMYYSNTIGYNRRVAPVPPTVPFTYKADNLLNKHQSVSTDNKRVVSQTYRPAARNQAVPVRASPIMMCPAAVGHPEKVLSETIKTEGRLERLKMKNDSCLPE